jgi:hypothetical protein
MLEITIDGLSPRQRILADLIWACDSREDIDGFIRFLPTQEMKDEARVIVDLMLMATIEQCYDGISPMDEAKEVLDKIAKRPYN